MSTLTIELPDELTQQIQQRGISQQRLETVVIHLVREFLSEWTENSSATAKLTWSDGEAFARRVIAKNRELFEELAQL